MQGNGRGSIEHWGISLICNLDFTMFYGTTSSVGVFLILFIYLTAIGLTPDGSSTSHIYTQTIHIIQRKENWEVKAVPRL
jgi:hypothetical protein